MRRGMWLGTPGTIKTTNVLRVELYLLTKEEGGRERGIRTNFTESVYCSTWDQVGRFRFDADLLMPGEHTTGHLFFINDVPIKKNMPFTLREQKNKTIARGIVTEVYEPYFIDTFWKFDSHEMLKKLKLMV